ncbi:hypothetical protein LXL04_003181 [Taraxacum kok-saghyz]
MPFLTIQIVAITATISSWILELDKYFTSCRPTSCVKQLNIVDMSCISSMTIDEEKISKTALLLFSRPWICYWILHSLAVLGESVDENLENNAIAFISRCQDQHGGYGGGPGQMPHLATTYVAGNSLITLGGHKSLSSINRCCQIMGRSEQDDFTAAQICWKFGPQCSHLYGNRIFSIRKENRSSLLSAIQMKSLHLLLLSFSALQPRAAPPFPTPTLKPADTSKRALGSDTNCWKFGPQCSHLYGNRIFSIRIEK